MTFELKKLTHEGIESALAKAERYRLLNEPAEAASICRDVLAVDADNQPALVALMLSLSDQYALGTDPSKEIDTLAVRITDPYEKAYYTGLALERRAKALFRQRANMGTRHMVHTWMHRAMHLFEEAEAVRPAGNDEPLLRWNACARFLMQNPGICQEVEEERVAVMSE
jgi:hypothetical protein